MTSTVQDAVTAMRRNFGIRLPGDTALHPRRMNSSTTQLRPLRMHNVFFVFKSSSFLTSSCVCFPLKISQFRPISFDHYVLYASFHNIIPHQSYFHSTLIILCSLTLHPFIPHHNVLRIIFFPLQLPSHSVLFFTFHS